MIMKDDFNWFSEELEIETEDYEPTRSKKSVFSTCFDQISAKIIFLIGILFFIKMCEMIFYLFGISILGKQASIYLNISLVTTSSFFSIVSVVKLVAYIILNLSISVELNPILSVYRLISLILWFISLTYYFEIMKKGLSDHFWLASKLSQAGLITSISFTITSFVVVVFDKYFLTKTLSSKFKDVTKTERMLAAMKNYIYEISTSSSQNIPALSYTDFFCVETSNEEQENDVERRGLDEIDARKAVLKIALPELHNVSDTKTLARDVFYKASKNNEVLTLDDFSDIFPTTQTAVNAFSYFDISSEKIISKKIFRDTIIIFYMDRVNLEKSIKRAEEFVDVIANFLNIIMFALLVLTYLVLFGIPLKELVALALSSALALNFIASGMAKDLYYNFMMLLSHQFDIGDEVIIEDIEYKVHEYGLLSTSLIAENGGKIKFLNSELWNKRLINMTSAPEKILIFKFYLRPNMQNDIFIKFKTEILNYVQHKKFDFFDTFSLQDSTESCTNIDRLECSLVLRCKTYKTKSKKFILRVEITSFLNNLIKKYEIAAD